MSLKVVANRDRAVKFTRKSLMSCLLYLGCIAQTLRPIIRSNKTHLIIVNVHAKV